MKRNRWMYVEATLAVLVAIALLAMSISGLSRSNSNAILERDREVLLESTEHHAKSVADTLDSRLRFVENLAVVLEYAADTDLHSLARILESIEKNTVIDDLFIVTADGVCLFSDGTEMSLSEEGFFGDGMNGNSGISEWSESPLIDGDKCAYYYAPIGENGEVRGVIVGCNYYRTFNDLYDLSGEENYLGCFLTNRHGDILLTNLDQQVGGNVLELMRDRMSEEDYQNMIAAMLGGRRGDYRYEGTYGKGLICFTPLGIQGGYVIQLYLSEYVDRSITALNRSHYIIEGFAVACLVVVAAVTVQVAWRRLSHREGLSEMALDALEEIFPRMAIVNWRKQSCVFIKDGEAEVAKPFQRYDWNQLREELLQFIAPEDVEKFRTFTSTEMMRRLCEHGEGSETCIYRRMHQGGYQWIQTFVIPGRGKKNRDSVLVYAKNIDESAKAEELHKQELWNALQKAKETEQTRTRFLQYIVSELQKPMEVSAQLGASARRFGETGNITGANHMIAHMIHMNRYEMTLLEDLMYISTHRVKRYTDSHQEKFPLRRLLEKCMTGLQAEGGSQSPDLRVKADQRLDTWYIGDWARLLQALRALAFQICDYNESLDRLTLEVTLEERSERNDRIALAFVYPAGSGETDSADFVMKMYENRNLNYSETSAEGGIGIRMAKMALNTLGGELRLMDGQGEEKCLSVSVELQRVTET